MQRLSNNNVLPTVVGLTNVAPLVLAAQRIQKRTKNMRNVPTATVSTTSITRHSAVFADSNDYQFLQRSKLPTMHFQKSLPRLPIPELAKSCERYLAALRPILSDSEYEDANACVHDFRNGICGELQMLLQQRDKKNKHTSYISEPWFDMYLTDRKPLPLNYNPVLVMKSNGTQTQLLRATNLIISSLRFWRSLRSNLLEPEVFHMNAAKSDNLQFRRWTRLAPSAIATYVAYAFKAFPLDMNQYEHLFGVTRVPHNKKDCLVSNPNAKHILVLRGGNLYAVNVLNESGAIIAPHIILGQLQTILDMDEGGENPVPVGILTTQERNAWALARSHLFETSQQNANFLEHEIDAALFCLCLDTANDIIYDENNPVPMLKQMLAGNGTNRWFDKSVSLIVNVDGTAAVNFEHSWGDGVAVLRYFNEIYKDTNAHQFVDESTVPKIPTPGSYYAVRPLRFIVDDRSTKDVQHAIVAHQAVVENLDMQIVRYAAINKIYCKQQQISPDAIMQLAFQLAYRQAFGHYVGTYESCSTAAFRHGRTETMRPCTIATKDFCEKLLCNTPNNATAAGKLRQMIVECSNIHSQLTKEAAMGQGFDRHLFALKHICLDRNIKLPSLFESDAYHKLNYNILSTSTLTSDALLAGGFGPVVRDGFGIGYSINNQECGAIITSYKNAAIGGNTGKQFADSLREAFVAINAVINAK